MNYAKFGRFTIKRVYNQFSRQYEDSWKIYDGNEVIAATRSYGEAIELAREIEERIERRKRENQEGEKK